MSMVNQVYKLLHKSYGPQGWWPLSKGRLKTRHHNGQPQTDHDRWEIIVGAVLTQNTSWQNVERVIENLNRQKLIRIERIRKAPVSKIAELVRPAGYFNQKAERLKLLAGYFSRHFDDKTIPSREELLSVKGIGPETADSILLYAFGRPYFVVDAYTRRIFSRLGLLGKNSSYDGIQELFMKELGRIKEKKRVEIFREYHALIVEHAKRHCRSRPECSGCVLSDVCGIRA